MKYIREEIHLHLRDGAFGKEQPALQLYLLDTGTGCSLAKKRPMILICPGGAYEYRSAREAEPVVMKFLAAGFHCALMEYSVVPAKWPCAARELARAVTVVRGKAEEWNVDSKAVYVCGFSAGGHLVASLGTLWNRPVFEEEFAEDGLIDRAYDTAGKPWRPDGMILCYPVITMGRATHGGSRDNLLGAEAAVLQQELSLELQVSKDTVPAFLWHTEEDGSVPVENSLEFALALRKEAVPFELHVYEKGGHGLALCNSLTATDQKQIVPDNEGWIQLAVQWVNRKPGGMI